MYQLLGKIFHESNDFWHMTDEHMMFWPFGGVWMWLLMMGYGLVVILLTNWTYQDAKMSDENTILWAFVVFFTMGFGILVYGLIRRPESSSLNKSNEIPTTREPASVEDNLYCESCGNALETNDLFCAKCGTSI